MDFSEFNPQSKAQWLQIIRESLKDVEPDDLIDQIEPGIVLDPFPHADDVISAATELLPGENGRSWLIGEDFHFIDPQKANDTLLHALKGGCNSPRLIPSGEKMDWDQALDGVHLPMIDLHLCVKDKNVKTILKRFFERSTGSEENIGLTVHGEKNATGVLELLVQYPMLRAVFKHKHAPGCRLEYTAAQFALILDALDDVPGAGIAGRIGISVEIGRQFFLEIAHLRALKILWQNISQAMDWPVDQLFLDVHFSPGSYDDDEHKNMIRAAIMALAAILGGADRLTILPAPGSFEDVSDFHRRIARNLHHLFVYESHLEKVFDPAAGSYYIDNLTKQIVDGIWEKLHK